MSANVLRTTRLAPSVRWTAGAVAVTVPAAIVLLVVYYAVGGPFGTLNDLANALVGVLSSFGLLSGLIVGYLLVITGIGFLVAGAAAGYL